MIFRGKLLLSAFVLISFLSANAQPYRQLNSSEILLGLKKLKTVGSVLYIAAHPDDENTRLLSYLANDVGVRTGYLALTRGDGGQNLIGTEQGEQLGLIRTQELLAARRLDGAEQFFTRAYDFGYSKNPEETFNIWNKDSILEDVVWMIRKFRPDVIITRFPDDGSGGHGHHTASSILAQEAYKAAADPKQFTSQLKYVEPWQAKRIFWNHWGRWRDANTDLSGLIELEVGVYNPLLGKSYGEMAGESRSMHKSQGFGSAERRGSIKEYFKLLGGEPAKTGLFDDIDLSWSRVEGAAEVDKIIKKAIAEYDPQKPEKILPYLIKVHTLLKGRTDHYSQLKLQQLTYLIINAGGLYAEVIATDYWATPGAEIPLAVSVVNRGSVPFKLNTVNINQLNKTPDKGATLNYNESLEDTFKINIPANYPYTTPYWLRNEKFKGTFNIPDKTEIGKAEDSNGLIAELSFEINGARVTLERPVLYKWVDPVKGEQYRALEIVPPVMINIEQAVFMAPNGQPRQIKMTLKAGKDNVMGKIVPQLPSGWKCEPASLPFELKNKKDEQLVSFTLTPSAEAVAGDFVAVAETEGKNVSSSLVLINHDHIPIQTYFPEAKAALVPLDIKIVGKKIGYIPGAGDEIPAGLRSVGYEVEMLTDDMLANADLSIYDAILSGIRAYNTNERLGYYYDRLMNYVKNGGTYVVQYNTSNRISSINSNIGPYPFTISRDRVTVEEAPVIFNTPEHPVLNYPNKITEKDFEGWIQERGLYFAQKPDAKYETPFSIADPGEEATKGSLLIVKEGKGYFVYTGLSFFRELPAGVPGAYRLMANILSLGKGK